MQKYNRGLGETKPPEPVEPVESLIFLLKKKTDEIKEKPHMLLEISFSGINRIASKAKCLFIILDDII